MDGTFKVVSEPFKQLYSIHAFVKQNNEIKQFPLAFVLMSRRRCKYYKKVLKAIKNLLHDEVKLQCVVANFETASWQAVQTVFPNVRLQGCLFHWTQAVWRKVQEIGLGTAYKKDDAVHKYIKKIMALPFLPHEHIIPMFETLKGFATSSLLQSLVSYVQSTWIDSIIWSPDRWSVFQRSVWTNNDVEGWHRRLNHNARPAKLPIYMLINLLHQESLFVTLQARLLSENKLKRQQRHKFSKLQARVCKYWEEFMEGDRTTKQLLRACSYLNGPS